VRNLSSSPRRANSARLSISKASQASRSRRDASLSVPHRRFSRV
jgi:hypothetical protein